MPRINPVRSLKNSCYRKIALSFDKYWMKDFDSSLTDMPRLMYVLGPFDNLTTEMVQDLLNALISEKCLKRQHFLMLLQHTVTSLNLKDAGLAANNDSIVKTVTNRCQNLVSLSLRGLNNISARELANLAREMTGLKSLDLGRTNCNDQVLSVLGNNCLQLMQLQIDGTKVTNSGAFSLCQTALPDKGCRQLVRLSVAGTMIQTNGALYCLKNLPELKYFDFDDISGLIKLDVEEKAKEGVEVKPYKLQIISTSATVAYDTMNTTHISQESFPFATESFVLACQWCPDTVEIIVRHGVTEKSLLAAKDLKNLQRMSIGSFEDLMLPSNLSPVLTEFGQQLVYLNLSDIDGFNLMAIGFYCLNLQEFTIFGSNEEGQGNSTPSDLPRDRMGLLFRNLKKLEILDTFLVENSPNVISLLKRAVNLADLNLSGNNVPWYTSELFVDILSTNPMSKLLKLQLSLCNNIDTAFVNSLLHMENDLAFLGLYRCQQITKKDSVEMIAFAKSRNFNLEIVWS